MTIPCVTWVGTWRTDDRVTWRTADDAEACADSAYDDALSEFERTEILDFEKAGEE
jgi:hypothetical protein